MDTASQPAAREPQLLVPALAGFYAIALPGGGPYSLDRRIGKEI